MNAYITATVVIPAASSHPAATRLCDRTVKFRGAARLAVLEPGGYTTHRTTASARRAELKAIKVASGWPTAVVDRAGVTQCWYQTGPRVGQGFYVEA